MKKMDNLGQTVTLYVELFLHFIGFIQILCVFYLYYKKSDLVHGGRSVFTFSIMACNICLILLSVASGSYHIIHFQNITCCGRYNLYEVDNDSSQYELVNKIIRWAMFPVTMAVQWFRFIYGLDRVVAARFPLKCDLWLTKKRCQVLNLVTWILVVLSHGTSKAVQYVTGTSLITEYIFHGFFLLPAVLDIALVVYTEIVVHTANINKTESLRRSGTKAIWIFRILSEQRNLIIISVTSFLATLGWPCFVTLKEFLQYDVIPNTRVVSIAMTVSYFIGLASILSDPWIYAFRRKAVLKTICRLRNSD